MPTGRRRLASSLRAAEPSSPNEAKALSNNPADNKVVSRDGFVGRFVEDDVPRHQDVYFARGKHSHSGVCLSLPWLRALRLLRGHFEPCSEGTRDGSDGLQLRVHFGREQSANGGRIPTDEPS